MKSCKEIMDEYSLYLNNQSFKQGHKNQFLSESRSIVLNESQREKYGFINVFIVTKKSIHGEHAEEDENGFIECYKYTEGIKQ